MSYLRYLRYLLRHKWYVAVECFKLGLYWMALAHDMSKFRPSEFLPYANHFFSNGWNINRGRDSHGHYNPANTREYFNKIMSNE